MSDLINLRNIPFLFCPQLKEKQHVYSFHKSKMVVLLEQRELERVGHILDVESQSPVT
jgi:hypothetical protein